MFSVIIGGISYAAVIRTLSGTNYFVISVPVAHPTKQMWIHIHKSTAPTADPQQFRLTPLEEAAALEYLNHAGLTLYRGVAIDSPGAADARNGICRPKPTATDDTPDYTSENSTTRFVPFSTDRNTAINFAKSGFNGKKKDKMLWLEADQPYGVLVEIRVNTSYSICIFDVGEIQVLAPPVGAATLLTPVTVVNNGLIVNIADSDLQVPLNATPGDFASLGRLLNRVEWDTKGRDSSLSEIIPDGIIKMRLAYNRGHYWDIFRIAQKKSAFSISRAWIVGRLYRGLRNLLAQVRVPGENRLPIFKNRLDAFCQEIEDQL